MDKIQKKISFITFNKSFKFPDVEMRYPTLPSVTYYKLIFIGKFLNAAVSLAEALFTASS